MKNSDSFKRTFLSPRTLLSKGDYTAIPFSPALGLRVLASVGLILLTPVFPLLLFPSSLFANDMLEESRTDIDYGVVGGVFAGVSTSWRGPLGKGVVFRVRRWWISSCRSVRFRGVKGACWAWCLVLGPGCASAQGRRRCSIVGAYIGMLAGRVARVSLVRCASDDTLCLLFRRGVALKRKKTELGSLVLGQGVSWDLPLSQIIPSSMGSRCLDSPSSQPALSGGLVLPTLFAVHGVLTPPQSTLLRRCHEKSSIRGNEVSPTFLWSTSTVENGDCIFEDLRNRLADGVG
ncbi:hypothetical protein F2Q69_00007180 [Brassica cretica]|uniref:Uncharacterized protein n=1 Tax=Brassica cretica TaxID=69181 RepID=A0A8S9NYX9_BRACR|nr:hypothetical protein F2Q69_00007180 [Brassica cretica]